ncbi:MULTISPECIES: metal-sulfur cluster assembly factor [unclassified Bacillus (in: firmicutes)]|uniref:metal-sulfur cluster assembly factor n=1 Tax=unclassified Bacillus (in: firmicutes) TaxID=185979 RepID=UPI001BE6E44A|nr:MULTISPECIES: metal-sulfur cluster assembly factor [unclassified Bacillus (in: firmicutes)]MBT2641996.1 metal-sulfur cluster assembly factor [Bacillus sp. ISL-41]MBT2662341.1 metal-sulfur cluster assembly factor [Bacillus sp. ISL-45]
MNELLEKIRGNLKTVIDPELNINVVDLGLIYEIDVPEPRKAKILMTLTTPGCPLHDSIASGIKYCVQGMEEIDHADVQLTWEPAWTPERMTEDGKRLLQGF